MERQGTVLYVDDDEANRFAFSCLFRQAGFDVAEAATGSEALRLVKGLPDLVILDVNLPDIDGLEVCRRIKSHPATTPIPVMHLSGVQATPAEKTHALEEGAVAFLTKPVEPQELIAQAKALMRLRQAEERERAADRQWQAIFDAMSDGVCLLDGQGQVLRCNRALAQLLHRQVEDVLGTKCPELTASAALVRMLETRRRETAELSLQDRCLEAVAEPLLAEDGSLTGAVCMLTDVTGRKRLEAQLRQALEAVRALLPTREASCQPGLAKEEAERVLDWLEANGFQRQEVAYEEGTGYAVRWGEAEAPTEAGRCRRRYCGPCPECGSMSRPYKVREMTPWSWALVAVGVVLWPLLALGLLLRVDVWRCWDCRAVQGRARRATLGW